MHTCALKHIVAAAPARPSRVRARLNKCQCGRCVSLNRLHRSLHTYIRQTAQGPTGLLPCRARFHNLKTLGRSSALLPPNRGPCCFTVTSMPQRLCIAGLRIVFLGIRVLNHTLPTAQVGSDPLLHCIRHLQLCLEKLQLVMLPAQAVMRQTGERRPSPKKGPGRANLSSQSLLSQHPALFQGGATVLWPLCCISYSAGTQRLRHASDLFALQECHRTDWQQTSWASRWTTKS